EPEVCLVILFFAFYLLLEEMDMLYHRHCQRMMHLRLRPDHYQTHVLQDKLLSVPVLDRFFNQQDTRPDFRLSREALTVLLDLLTNERRHGWGATLETLVFLFWLVNGASYRVISRVFGMPRSTVHRIVHRVTEGVVTSEDQEAVSQGFARLARHRAFLEAAGAIDDCHVHIKPQSGPDGECYRNRKLFPSVILQAVYDHHGCFIDTYVGWPGSVHDSRVLRRSPLYRTSVYPPPGFIIERTFGMMKPRFCAIFLQALEVHHTFVPYVITACAILHNFCLGVGDIIAPEDEQEEDVSEDEGDSDLVAVSGTAWRDRLSAEVSALEEVPTDHDYF
ncbi:putative nuclease HARBI1-like, partial [Triplophysa rosa]